MSRELRSYLGILLGLVSGAYLYAFFRSVAPQGLAFGVALIGVSAGFGARLGRTLGTPTQLRILIFGALFTALLTEYFVSQNLALGDSHPSFARHLLRDPLRLLFDIGFLVGGIFLGVRIIFARRN